MSNNATPHPTKTKPVNLKLSGLHCASCALTIQQSLEKLPQVESASVNYASEEASVVLKKPIKKMKVLTQAVEASGYGASLIDDQQNSLDPSVKETDDHAHHHHQISSTLTHKLTLGIIVTAILMVGMVPMAPAIFHHPLVGWLLSTPVQFWVGFDFYRRALAALRHRRANMDTLIVIGTSVAYFYSVANVLFADWLTALGLPVHYYFETAAAIITFVLLGKFLEERAKAHTSSAISALLGLTPKTALVKKSGQWQETPLSQVEVGDLILVKAGQNIPVDGQVVGGNSTVDESTITGESLPVVKAIKDKVIGGTLNQAGSLEIKAAKVGSQTLLASIIELVRQAQNSRPKIQALVDQVSAVFVPVVIVLSVLSLIAWTLLGPEPSFLFGLLSMITVLIIACPCALGLATPTALMVGIGKGANLGILIKDAQVLETAHQVKAVLFDKTGTLTKGEPKVGSTLWYDRGGKKLEGQKLDPKLVASLIAIEERSAHPLGKAINTFLLEELSAQIGSSAAELRQLAAKIVLQKFSDTAGRGVRARVLDQELLIGSRQFITEQQVTLPSSLESDLQAIALPAASQVLVAVDNRLLAVLLISDPVREEAALSIARLKKAGLVTIMVTGDRQATARAIGKQVGIDEIHAEVMPGDKQEILKAAREKYGKVAMVGDGTNDAPALALADVSIAMGKGTDIAIKTAGLTLLRDDLSLVPTALELSRATMNTLKQNLFWAFFYNVSLIPVAMGVLYPFIGLLLNPMLAALAMAFSSVSVVLNALRLKRFAPSQAVIKTKSELAPISLESGS